MYTDWVLQAWRPHLGRVPNRLEMQDASEIKDVSIAIW